MKRHTSKIIALSLAFIMTLMTLVPYQSGLGFTFANTGDAAQAEEPAEVTPVENADVGEEAAPGDSEESAAGEPQVGDDSDKSKDAASEERPSGDSEESAADDKKGEAAPQIGFEGKEFDVTIEASPDAGLPGDTELNAREITAKDKEYKEYYEKALETVQADAKRGSTRTVRFVRLYDMTLTSGDEELEPDAAVDVTIDYSKAVDACKAESAEDPEGIKVLHFGETKKGELKADILESKATEATVDDKALTEAKFEAEGFSVYAVVYTVDFHYGDGEYDFSIAGESSIMLSEVMERLHMEPLTINDVKSAKFSDPELVKVQKARGAVNAENGTAPADDWKLTSLKPFNTDETLTLTLNDGSKVEVKVTDASAINIKEGESQWYTTDNINRMVPGTMTQPGIVRQPSNNDSLNADRYKVGEDNSTDNKADSIWKKSSYDPDSNTVSIEMDYFRQIYTSKLDFIFVIDETGTMNKDVTVDVENADHTVTTYKASRAFWAREIALRASKFIFDWNDYNITHRDSDNGSEGTQNNTGFNNRTYYISWGGSKYIKSGFKTSYADASAWYQQNSKIVGGGTNHNTTATHIQPVINQSIADGRVPVVIYLSDFGSAMNSFKVASQQMLSQADVYPVLIYANDRHSQERRSKLNADTSHHYMMEDNDPISLLPVFEKIIKQAISYVDPKTTVTDQLSTSLTGAADSGITATTSAEDAAAKNNGGSVFKEGGQTSYDSSTGTVNWVMNNGTDEAGQTNRLKAGENVYTSTVSVPMKSNVVVSGSMPTNEGMQVKDAKGITNKIDGNNNPIIGKGVKFVLGVLDENGSKTNNVINNAGFTLAKTSGSGAGNGGIYTTSGSGSFTVSLSDAEFKPGDVYTLTQTSTNTDIAVMPEPAVWTLTVNSDYTITASYNGDAKLALTAENGAFRIWNKSKASAFTPLVPVVVKKTWDGYSASNSDAVQFTVLGNDGNGGTIELPAYSTNDRTVADFESTKVTELKKSDRSPEAGNAEWTKTVYVPAYSGTGSARVVFYDTNTNQYTNGYTIHEDGMTVEEHPGKWNTDINPDGKTAAKDYTYYTYSGEEGWKTIDTSTSSTEHQLEFESFIRFGNKENITKIVITYEYTENGNKKLGRTTLTIPAQKIVAGHHYYFRGFKMPSSWSVSTANTASIKKLEYVDNNNNVYVPYDEDNGIDVIDSTLRFENTTSGATSVSSYTTEYYATVEKNTIEAHGLQYPILQMSNSFTPLYELTISNSFRDATPIEHVTATGDDSDHTKEQVQSVTYSVLNGDGEEIKTVTLNKAWNDSWTQGQPLNCESKTLELPAGSYTVKQKYYTIADGRKVSADSDGKFAAYSANKGSETVSLGGAMGGNATASFENTRLTHKVIVKTIWEYPEDMEKTTTYNNGTSDVTVKNEDIIIPFKIGTSIFRHHGINSKSTTPAWEDDENDIPSFGVDGYPIICEMDFDQLETDPQYRDTLEVLYTFYTEITQYPKAINANNADDDVTFTINIMRNRMPLQIKKTWASNANGDADGGNDNVTVQLVNTNTHQPVTPQYEEDPAIVLEKESGWKTTVYVPGGFDYTLKETKIGNTAVGSQTAYDQTYTYTDNVDTVSETEAVAIAAFDNEKVEGHEDYIPVASVRNTHIDDITISLKDFKTEADISGGKFSLYEGDLSDTQIVSATAVWSTPPLIGGNTIPGSELDVGKTYTLKQTKTDDAYALPGYTWKFSIGTDGDVTVVSDTDKVQNNDVAKVRTQGMEATSDTELTVYNETCNKLTIENIAESKYTLTSVFGNNGVYLLNDDGTYAASPSEVAAGSTVKLAILSGANNHCNVNGQFEDAAEGDIIKATLSNDAEKIFTIDGTNQWKTFYGNGDARNVSANLGAAGSTVKVTFTLDSYYTYLKVTKMLPGDYDNRAADYTFNVGITGAPAGTHVAKVTNESTGAVVALTSDSFTLKHNEHVILRVPANKEVSITETPVQGYGVEIDKTGVASPSEATIDLTHANVKVTLKSRYTVAEPASVIFENSLEHPPVPSGLKIAGGVLAIALIVVLAMLYYVSNRRRRRA